MSISYAITVCNEEKEIKQLLDFLLPYKHSEDEICVLVDKPKASPSLLTLLHQYRTNGDIILAESAFRGDFSEWKNELNRMCKSDYIFNIDADEIPDDSLMKNVRRVAEIGAELVFVPRVNTVVGITQEDIQKWGWSRSEEGYINYPDYQGRFYKNKDSIRWTGKVHEQIKGHLTYAVLLSDNPPNLCLHHVKSIERQQKQNSFYETL